MTTDTELDMMYEAAVADDWEEQNKPAAMVYPEWVLAIKKVQTAQAMLSEAVELLKDAAEMIPDSREDDRILSIADEVEFLLQDLQKQEERMNKA